MRARPSVAASSPAARSGTTAALTMIERLPSSPRPVERDARQRRRRPACRAARRRSLRRTGRRTRRGASGRPPRRAARRTAARAPCSTGRSGRPRSSDQQAVVERLENVLVEGAQAIELDGLDVQLAVQARVLERRRNLAGHGRRAAPCPRCAAARRCPSGRAPARAIVPSFDTHGNEVVETFVAPELDLLGGEAAGGDRIVERHGVAGVEPRADARSRCGSAGGCRSPKPDARTRREVRRRLRRPASAPSGRRAASP